MDPTNDVAAGAKWTLIVDPPRGGHTLEVGEWMQWFQGVHPQRVACSEGGDMHRWQDEEVKR